MEDTLTEVCKKYDNIPVSVFIDNCKNAKIGDAVSTLDLINRGAVLGNFADYLVLNGRNYEPCQFADAEWLDECMGVKARIPVAYSERGKQLEPLPFLQSN
jgi:hypothetical protein